jgi:hypothetical protein
VLPVYPALGLLWFVMGVSIMRKCHDGLGSTLLLLGPLLLGPGAARADDLANLREEVVALKANYESRIAALETRISLLESQAQAAPLAEAPPPSPPSGAGQTAFNPAMSVILAGSYANLSGDPSTYRIAGFIPSGGEAGPGERGFNLGESELTFSANVDPYFFANLTAAVDNANSIHAEEAYFKTLALPSGFLLKGGRFFSGLGYLNEVHAHAWDFLDQPLVYQVFLGNQLAQDGLQMKWLAPTDVFMEFGAEAGNGRSFPGTDLNRNGANSTVLFAHLGSDIGDSASWRAGASWLALRAKDRSWVSVDSADTPITNAFSGRARIWGADFIFKWAPHGNSNLRQLKVQAEYLHRSESGTLAVDTTGRDLGGAYESSQSGWYLQGSYQFRPRWRLGARFDSLHSGNPRIALLQSGALTAADLPDLLASSPHRSSLMLDWSPSEFSRLRMQFAWDEARRRESDRQLFLQYLYSIGAHGAHKY